MRVKPHGQRLLYYCIEYREKKWFNWFNFWERYSYTWHSSIDIFDPHQPYLYEKYEYALERARMLKANPELIDDNNEKRWNEYNECCDRLTKYREERNKSTTL